MVVSWSMDVCMDVKASRVSMLDTIELDFGLGSQVGLLVLDGLIWCCVLVPRPSRKGPAGRAWPSSKGPAACVCWPYKTTRTHGPLYSSSISPSQQDSLLYTQFSRTHSSSIHSIHYGTHLSLYLNISMCDLVLKDLLRRI
jgi:hypothetical protein